MSMGRQLVAVTCVALLATACTPDPEPAASPGPVVSTPAETAQEREQRLAYEAAEKSYRAFRSTLNSSLNRGGAKEATMEMKATAAGPYLNDFTQLIKAYEAAGTYSVGREKIGFVRRGGYDSTSLILNVCEDSRAVRDYDQRKRLLGRGEVRSATIEVRQVDGEWKMWDGTGEKIVRCE